jgi:predicted RND superfamily exporter protein
LSSLHLFIFRFHKYIIILCGILTLFAAILTTQLKLDLNLLSLLPSDDPSVKTFFEISKDFGVQSVLVAVIEVPPDFSQSKSESFVDILVKNLRKSTLIKEINYKSSERDLSLLFQTYMEYFPVFLRTRELNELAQKLSDSEIQRQVRENKKLLMTPFSIITKELIYNDPLGLRKLIQTNLTPPDGKYPFVPHRGYYRTKNANIYFLFIKPKKPPQNVAFSKQLMEEVRNFEKISLSELSKEYETSIKGLTISYTGGYPIAIKDEATTKRDIKVTILTSFLGVLILFGLSFRRLKVIFYVATPLAIGLIWTLGFARIVFHHLNILTCVFSAVLIGLGIDFAIHILNRYYVQDENNLDISTRLKHTFQKSGGSIVIGGITTAFAFYAIALSDFRGFRELGILTGTGILLCLVVMIFLLPSLLVYFSKKRGNGRDITVAGFGLKAVFGMLWKYPKTLLAIDFVIICLLGITGSKIGFDENLKNFRQADHDVLILQDKVTGWLGGSTGQVLLVVEGNSESDCMEINTSIYKALMELDGSRLIAGIKSISGYLPSPGEQMINAEFIKKHPEYFNIARIKRTFDEALNNNGFERSALYDDYFKVLSKALLTNKIFLPSEILNTKAGNFLGLFILGNGKSYRLVTYIIPKKDLWSRTDTNEVKELIIGKLKDKGIGKDRYKLTGANLLTGDLKEIIIKNLKTSMRLAGLIIVIVLLLYYRNLKLLALSTLPLIIGLVTLTGIMVIFHLDFNFLNCIVLPMIIGIGIDDGVHLANTFHHSKNSHILESVSHTGRAVVLTSLTTLVGFGSIALSHYPGLKSMGYVACIGISACLFASIIVLPAIFAVISSRSRKSLTHY